MKKHFRIKNIIFIITVFFVVYFLGKNLLPSATMFNFHDETQAARVQEFTFNLQNGIIPPRTAPHFSFQMGYPVFNFYSPFPYWITGSLHILGLDVADSIKLSFLLALCSAFLGMYAFLKLYFRYAPSVFGAVLYVASPWLASEIFVRGNLGEVWFWGLFPLALYAVYEQEEYNSPFIFGLTVFILSCIFTVHNIFSMLFVPIAVLYIWLIGGRLRSYLGLLLSLLISAYFILPAVAESGLTYAREVAVMTKYSDHYLCLQQLWAAPFWGYAGSTPGCIADGMAFMIGKSQIVFGLLGMLLFFAYFINRYFISKKKQKSVEQIRIGIYLIVFIGTITALFLITEISKPVWFTFSPVLSLFQFPWRFLMFVVFGFSFFSAYFFNKFKSMGVLFVIPVIGLYALFNSGGYFDKPVISKGKYNLMFLSSDYINNSVAYKIPEYLPKTADYKTWRVFENKNFLADSFIEMKDKKQIMNEQIEPFDKFAQTNSENFLINIHYFPFWKIRINGESYIPDTFDSLGRPMITTLPGEKTVEVFYQETAVEQAGNAITIAAMMTVLLYMISPLLLKKKQFKKLQTLLRL